MKKQFIIAVTMIWFVAGCDLKKEITQTTTQEAKTVTLVHGENTPQSQEVIDYVEKLLANYPNIGEEGMISLNYADATHTDSSQTYALFLVTNRTADTIDRRFQFTINWAYEDAVVYKDQKVLYEPTKFGVLQPNTTAIMFLPIPTDLVHAVENMTDNSKVTLSISDLKYVE